MSNSWFASPTVSVPAHWMKNSILLPQIDASIKVFFFFSSFKIDFDYLCMAFVVTFYMTFFSSFGSVSLSLSLVIHSFQSSATTRDTYKQTAPELCAVVLDESAVCMLVLLIDDGFQHGNVYCSDRNTPACIAVGGNCMHESFTQRPTQSAYVCVLCIFVCVAGKHINRSPVCVRTVRQSCHSGSPALRLCFGLSTWYCAANADSPCRVVMNGNRMIFSFILFFQRKKWKFQTKNCVWFSFLHFIFFLRLSSSNKKAHSVHIVI